MGICVALAALTLAVFGQTLRHEFINFDDDHYVYENPMVTAGLTQKGIASAFLHGSAENWDPVTTLSHMADCQVYGLNAGGHHLTNVVLHTGSVLLLFLVPPLAIGAMRRPTRRATTVRSPASVSSDAVTGPAKPSLPRA